MESIESKKSKFTKSFLWKIIAIVTFAIMFIPMMYSLFYLGAFWDPYGSLDKVPVAFVNLDKSYMRDGKSYTYGKDLEKKLKDNTSFKWQFVSYNKAKDGVDHTSYYAMIVIPQDFSKKLADSANGDFKKPQIIYRANKGRNFIFSLLSLKGAESIQNQITNNISKETSKVLVDKLYEVKDSIKDASDAQDKIQDGSQKLLDGSGTLATNLVTAYDGSNKLKTGLDQLSNGGSQLNSGLYTAYNGSNTLGAGLEKLASGQKEVLYGEDSLINGLNTFKTKLSSSDSSKMAELVQGAQSVDKSTQILQSTLSKGGATFKSSIDAAADAVSAVDAANSKADDLLTQALADLKAGNTGNAEDKIKYAKALTSGIKDKNLTNNLANTLYKSDNTVNDIADNVAALQKKGTSNVAAGVQQAVQETSTTLSTANQGVDELLDGANKLKAGSTQIYNGLSTAASSTGTLSNGLSQLNTGATQLTSGLNTAASSTATLASGLGQLSDGAKTLNSGLGTLNDGTKKLKDGLNDGYTNINNNLKFTSSAMSKFVSKPVNLSDQSINDVKSYGEGLAPYFISLSLWLGAMFINLVLTLIDKLKLADNKFYNSFLGKFAVGVGLVTIQAIVLAISLNAGLGLDAIKTPYLYLNNIFTSIVFFSVMYGLSAAFGIMSTPISFVLLILQLSSCAGTFPIETSPLFYRLANKFIPMTYTVNIVRMILSGINHSDLMHNISILLTFMFTLLVGGFLIQTIRTKLTKQIISKKAVEKAA